MIQGRPGLFMPFFKLWYWRYFTQLLQFCLITIVQVLAPYCCFLTTLILVSLAPFYFVINRKTEIPSLESCPTITHCPKYKFLSLHLKWLALSEWSNSWLLRIDGCSLRAFNKRKRTCMRIYIAYTSACLKVNYICRGNVSTHYFSRTA
jgi:hypothetical protein